VAVALAAICVTVAVGTPVCVAAVAVALTDEVAEAELTSCVAGRLPLWVLCETGMRRAPIPRDPAGGAGQAKLVGKV
jgi:hypothetical protein